MKTFILIGIIVAVLAVLGAVYYLGYSHYQPPVVQNITTNEYTFMDSIPGAIKIVPITLPDGKPGKTENATMDTTLTSPSGNSRVSLGIGYNEYSNLFNLRANFSEAIPELKPTPPRAIGFIGAVGIGFRDSLQLRDAELSAGIELREKYSVSLFGRTDRTYGIRFGVRF